MTHLPVLAVVGPLLCAFLTPLIALIANRFRRLPVLVFATAEILVLLLLIPKVASEGVIEYPLGGWGARVGIALMIDGFGLFFALVAATGIWMVVVYSLDHIERCDYRYFVLVFIVLGGVTGMFFTGDLFNLYVFLELASMACFPLIAFARSRGAVQAAFRYMLYSTVASAFVLLGIALTYGATGALNLRQAAVGLEGADAAVRSAILGLLFIGFSIKVAMVPFHAWLPEAHGTALAPVSALLSGVMLNTGIYAIVRLLVAFAPGTALGRAEWILLNLGAVSVIVGHSLALGQTNLKKMLAYSSIAHVGIIVIGAGLGTVPGLMGSLFHAMNHMFMKSTAFFAAGQLGVHRRFEVAEMHGVGWQAPFAAAVFLVSALSLIGLPPLGGFIGKWEITLDAVRQRHFFHAAAILFGTLLSAVYYGRAVRTFFSAPAQGAPGKSSEGLLTSLVLVGGATGCVVPFFLWGTMEPVLTHIADLVRR